MNSHRFEPAGPVRGQYVPPADKSISHRAALFGAMTDQPVYIHNYLKSADTTSTLEALLSLGAGVDESGGQLTVRGVGLRAALEATGGVIDVGNSGTLLRLLPGWLAGQAGGRWSLDGDESIGRRPVDRVVEPLRRMGAQVQARDDRFTPLVVSGTELEGIHYEMPVPSAQVKSCVLIAGMLASGRTSITEGTMSRDHTERMMRHARVPFERDGLTGTVSQVDELELEEIYVPGDPSSAAFMAAAACLVPHSKLVISDVGLNWTRTGFYRIAQRMGAVIVGELEEPGTFSDEEPVGDLDVAAGPLEGTEVLPEEIPLAIDELTLVALLGAFAEGDTVVRGAAELRHKESDRITATVGGLRGLGADIEELEDGFVVHGTGEPLRGGTIDSLGDHRLAMLGAVAGLASREGVEVVNMEAAAVSYPGFVDDLTALIAGS
ncbi:MAG TPA: 3-phosphoshikimate 1-carboxyvinyltransferase [Thermoleophilaceae bacterium]|nr:3-phosphoshikimate 1-carboxyvinyltransferase [Thermoleophilaceae bacterium]